MTPKTAKIVKPKAGRYFEAVGRRKTSIARVRIHAGKPGTNVEVNDKKFAVYFPLEKHRRTVVSPFEGLSLKEYDVTAKVSGGGVSSQAEAVRLGVSRALILMNPIWRSRLKVLGFMKRDPRMVERKKPGLRKARRPQQWRKR
ncbi:MAG: 30S ribosomal protein S9 [Candidatus Paceibacterota bacterium]|jgi:small subunit ribosomal protein S9